MHNKHLNMALSASLAALIAIGNILPAMATSESIFSLDVEVNQDPSLVNIQVPANIQMKLKLDGSIEFPDTEIVNLNQTDIISLK